MTHHIHLKQFFAAVALLLCLTTSSLYAQLPVMVNDIYPGAGSGLDQYNNKPPVNINGTVYFVGTDNTHGAELWKSDGTETGTVLVKDIYAGSNSSGPSSLVNVNGVLFFYALDPQSGYSLFKSDGTEAGTLKVKSFTQNYYNQPSNLTDVNGTLFFVANDGSQGSELWKSDGTTTGTILVKDIYSGSTSSNPISLVNAGGVLYFFATDATHGQELWKSDGTETGTVLVKDIEPGTGNGVYNQLVTVGSQVYFIGGPYVNNSPNYEIWKSDGTDTGTTLVKDLIPGSANYYYDYISNLFSFNGTLYFKYSYSGDQLWKTDGTESGTVKVFPVQSQGVSINYLTKTSNSIYFFDNSNRLWKSNGSTEGTVLVKTFSNGFSLGTGGNGTPTGVGTLLYFQGNQSNTGYELWKSDGTEAGTTMLPEIQPGTGSSYPGNFVDVNNSLFFTATTDLYGRELYALKTCQLPIIVAQPVSGSGVCAGSAVTASVTATGTGLTYQWYNNLAQPISGATNATLTLTNVQSSQDGKYRCKVTNSCGSITSDPFSLSISSPPLINQQPANQSLCNQAVGQTGSASFYASVLGNYLKYQWETRANASASWITLNNETNASGNQAVSGTTSYYINLTSYSQYFQNGQQFRVKVTAVNCPDVVYSNPATLNIITPVIITQPTDQVICGETSAKFKVVANAGGGATVSYQWLYYDSSYGWRQATGEGFSGYTTSELTVSGTQLINGRQFQVYVYNSFCGTTYYSNQVALITGGGITVSSQPTSQTICSNSNAASFSVAATASGSLQYRWQWRSGEGAGWQDLSDGNGISGATTATLIVTSTSSYFSYYNSAQYRVKLTTATGSCPGDLYSTVANLTRDNGPGISGQPTYQNYVCAGGTASVSVVATGSGPLTYQWYKYNQTAVSGATSATLTLTNPQPEPGYTDYAGWYVCRVTNSCGTVTSGGSYIYIRIGAPTISSQPGSQTLCSTNGSVNFYANASGSDQAQWETRTDSNAPWLPLTDSMTGISGAEAVGTLFISSSSAYFRAGQQFRLRVSNTCSNTAVYSNPATLYFYTPAAFSSQPASQTVCANATVSFSAAAGNDGRYYSYGWQYNDGPGWVPIFGDTQEIQGYSQNQLTVSGSQIINGRKFRLVATDNSCGSAANSDEAVLSVINGVTVTAQPVNQTVCTNGTVSFSVVAVSSQTVSYQWQWRYGDNYTWQDVTNGAGYAGATTSNLTVTGNALRGGNQVRVKLQSGACPTPSYTSLASIITISPPYMYTNPPASQTVCAGTPVTAELRAYYNRPDQTYVTDNTLTYQWYRNNTTVSGATSATLSIPNASTANAGEYKAIITNACGSVTSSIFTLYLSDAPLISSQPNPLVEYCPGATSGIQLTASVYGQNLTLLWETRVNSAAAWEPVPPTSQTAVGSNGDYKQAYYTVGSTLFQDGRQFRLKAGSAGCSGITYSDPTTISIYKSATFSTQPGSQTICASGTTSFSAVAVNPYTNNGYFYTVWQYFDGTTWQAASVTGMSGYNTSQLTVSGAAVVNGRRFRMQAYNLYFNCVQAYSSEAVVTTVDAVAITAHPANQTACSTTGSASFSVAAAGADIQYQWETGSGNIWTPLINTSGISGATTAQLTVGPGSYLISGQQFRVKLTTLDCPTAAYSNAATLNLFTIPGIYSGPSPASQIVCAGSQAGTSILATSSLPLTYQWYLGTTAVPGAIQNVLSIGNVQAAQAGAYTAQVFNVCGTATSQIYSLSISQAPTVTDQPQPLTVCAGTTNNATFSVAAIGQTLNYQWQTRATTTANWADLTDAVNGQGVTLLTGAATTNLNIRPASEFYANGQQFRARIYSATCQQEVFSTPVALTLQGPLLITAQPSSVTVCNAGVASFSIAVNANDTGTPIYQWQYLNNTTWTSIGVNSDEFAGVGTYALTVSGSQLVNGRKFRVLVYGSQCSSNAVTSTEATLSTASGIVISGQPVSQTVCNTGTVSFTVGADAAEAISYQWESFDNNGWTTATDTNGLNGVTSATLTATAAALSDGRQFRVKLNTATCPAALYSNAASLAVSAPATLSSDLPASFTVCPSNTNEQIAVTAIGTGLTFDWQTRANNAATWVAAPIQYVYTNGSNGSRYQFPGNAFPDAQQFRVQITSTVCSTITYSQVATLTLRQAPAIAVQPTNLTFCANTSVTFSVSATINNTGYGPQYDWQYLDGSLWISASGNEFAGQGTNQLNVSGAQVVEGRRFRVIVGDRYGYSCLVTTSNEVTLIKGTPVSITSQPLSQAALPNSPVSFVVSATGTTGAVLYQWESRGNATETWTALTDGASISGVTTATLTVNYTQQGDGRQFRVKLSSASCSTPSYSDVATLTIKTPDLAVRNVTSDRTTVGLNDVVTVSWSIANDGTASSPVDWSERIYLQSPAGANRTLIKQVPFANSNSLASSQSVPRSETLTIPAQLLIDDQAVFVVEVIPGSSIQEAPGAQANNIGIQQNAWSIKRELFLALSASELTEGNTSGITATVSRTGSLATSLTVTVGISNPSRFAYPTFVVIPAGQSGVSFALSVPDNTTIEGKQTYQLQVSAAGYQGGQADVSVLDNDTPSLAIVNLPASTTEGQTVMFTVTTNLAPASPLTVFLQSSSPTRFPVPASVTIPAGSVSAVVSVTLAQNTIPEIDLAVTVTAGASSYNPATDTIQVKDDDLPNLELVILAGNISESAGANATQAVLRRTSSSSSIAFTANLSASLPNTLLLPGAISLAEGENEKTFTIGVVDNSVLDGQRLVTVTASLFVASCGCNAPPTSSGSVSATIIVNDDDGPSLNLTVSQQTLLEGLANAGSLRITRNSSTTAALSVTLTSSDLTEATLPATAIIPVGQAFVDVPITTIDDGIADGNQTVYFTATATGFSSGSTYVVVTDLNKPDLQIPLVQVTSNKVQAGDDITYQVSVKNSGGFTAPSGILVRGYLSTDNVIDASDVLLSEDVLGEAIPAGQTKIIAKSVKAPGIQGSYKLLFWANPDATLAELLLTNNVSTPVSLTIDPNYTATAVVASLYFLKGTNIPITGSAAKSNGSPAAKVPVEVYVITNGIRRAVLDTTDASGNFSVPFVPLSGEAGHYIVGASFPGLNQTTEQDGFEILGVRINGGNNILFTATLNETLSGSMSIENLSGKSLSNLTLLPVTLPNGAVIQFATLPTLAGNTSAMLEYTVKGSVLTSGNSYETVNFQAKSAEGTVQNVNAYYYCQAANAYIVSDISHIQANVSQSSGGRQIQIKLINKGKGATGNVTLDLPNVNWLSSTTPKTLSSIAPGDSAFAVLKFTALSEVPFNNPITGSIGISSANGNSFTVPFTFEKVSESSGTARITVTDQFTYYTEGGPKVKDALVKITNYFTGEVYVEGYTNAEGILISSNIPEGKHRIVVEKDKHLSYDSVIEITPGVTTELTAFLNYQAITFSWSVVPTSVKDQYEVVLETKFETNVPAPVVTIEMPKTMPKLSAGQTYPFKITLTNHGLITAEDVTLGLPTTDFEYEFITNYIPADLPANYSIQIPVVMRRRSGLTSGRLSAEENNGSCTDFAGVVYKYKCNTTNGLWDRTGVLFTYNGRVCGPGGGGGSGGFMTIDQFAAYYDAWAAGMAAMGQVGAKILCFNCSGPTGGGKAGPIEPTPESKDEKKSCVACIAGIGQAIAGCVPEGDKAGLLICYAGVLLDGTVHDKVHQVIKCRLESIRDQLLSKIPGVGLLLCVKGGLEAIEKCKNTESSDAKTSSENAWNDAGQLPNAALNEIAGNLQIVLSGYTSIRSWMTEFFGDMIDAEGWVVLSPLILPYVSDLQPIPTNVQADIINKLTGYDIAPAALSSFFTRWNTSIEARNKNILTPNTEYPNIINWNQVDVYVTALIEAHNYSVNKDFKTIDEMHRASIDALNEIIDGQKEGVCASVTVQFNQQLTMTREAFEGTLEITNGHPTDAMKTISVNIQITDENGTPSNGLFEIQPQTPANLADINAGQSGSVKFIFIPTVGAAPQASKVYKFGGSISYLDPYAKAVVTLPLAAVSITVNPSPNLMLHYFMERNILGDDALTSPEVEPSVPAELAVMVENHGYGPARDMTISSAQPKIVDNEKGLAINFNLIGSNLQGQPKQLGLMNINFGEIPAQQTRIGQWYFTSSLLGKFISYDAKVVHNSSFGNKDLSLIQGVKLHELTKSIRLYGDLEDGITDFLVNDIFDVNDQPDIIYFSQGNRTAKVSPATSGSFSAPVSGPTFTNTLTVTPSEAGFNYIKLPDPGNRLYELVSVTRNDGQVIPLNNAWLTFVTLPVSRSPIYENKFHIVDNFASTTSATYTVVWKPKNINVPKVDSIAGAPTQVSSTQVKNLKVYFNKQIDLATFTYDDLTLTLQGGQNVINSSVVITRLDTASFNVDLSAITTGNGLYVFTAQAAAVKDLYGVSGTAGKQVSWTQFLNGVSFTGLQDSYCSNAISQTLIGVPSGGTFSGPGITGNVFDPVVAGVGSHIITYSKDGKSISDTTKVNPAPSITIRPGSTTLTCASPMLSLSAIGADSLRWSTGATSSIISVTAAGVYSVTALTSSGCTAVASTTVSGNATLPVVTLASNGPLSCSATSVTLTAGGLGAGAIYTFSTGATQVSNTSMATVATAGVYSVTARSASGCSAVASTTVTGDATIPVMTLTNNGPLSCTATSVTLTADGLGAGASYTFSTGATQISSGPTATVSTPGVYSVTGVSGSGCSVVASTTVVADQNVLSATLVNNGPLSCTMTSVTLTAGGGGSGASYHFSSGATQTGNGPIATVSVAGVYSVTVISSSGCSAITSTTVTDGSGVTLASISPQSATLTCATPTMSLTASGGVSYRWEDGSVNAVRPVSTTGVYSVTVSSASGCTALASTTVVSDAGVALASISPSSATLTCASPTVSLTASGGVSYRWEDNSTNPVRPVSTTGLYSVTVTAASGCTALVSTKIVGGSNVVLASISPSSATLTCTSPVVSLTASGGGSYKWEDGSINSVRLVSTTGTYSVTVTTGNGCTATASTTIGQDQTAPPAKITASSATLTCATPTVSLTASGGVSYRWDDNSVDAVRPVSTTGTYSVTVTAANGCTATVRATINGDRSLPIAVISPRSATLTCATPTVSLTASGGTSYRWEDGSVNAVRPVSVTGIYSVTVTAAGGCTNVASLSIGQDLVPLTATLIASGTLTCSQTSVTLTAGGGQAYSFSGPGIITQDGSGIAVVNSGGVYSVTATGVNGCSASQTATVMSSTTVATPNFATSSSQAVAAGLTNIIVIQNSGTVSFSATNCSGTLNWSGNGQAGTTILNAPTSTTGTFVYQATCTVGTCISAPASVTITVNAANTAPVATTTASQTATLGLPFAYTVSAFTDAETPTSLTYSAQISPANSLSFDAITRVLSGTPSLSGVSSVTITATDPGGLSATTTFTITVNSAPLVTDRLSVLSRDPDNGQLNTNTLKPYLQLQNDGEQGIPYAEISVRYWLTVENPAPLRFDINYAQMGNDKVHPTYVTLNTPRPGATGYIEYRFDASAGSLGSHSTAVIQNSANKQDYSYFSQGDDYSYKNTGDYTLNPHITAYRNGLLIYGTEPAPSATPPLTAVVSASPTSILPTGITTLSATVSGGQTPYSYSFSGPGTLVPNGNTAMVSGLSAGVQTFTLVVSDATQPLSQSISATVSVTVSTSSPVNTAPVATANASQTATLGVPFAYTVNTFTDAETPASLTYSAQISPANSLSFDAANRVISGTPSLSGVSSVTITATDPGGLTATTSFSITIQPAPLGGNSLSLVASANPTVLLTTATTSLSANVSGGTQPYSYNFSGPGTLVPNGNTASVSGLNAGVQTFTIVVSDATQPLSQSLSTTVSVTVTQPNRPPTVATLVPPQSSTVNSAYTLSLANTFADLDTPASLTLSVAGLPTSLSLLGSIITGTPSTTLGSPYSLTVTATDPGGLSVSTSFVLTVNPAPLVTDRLSVLSRDPDNGQLNTNTLKPYLQLQNDGEQGIPYAEISVRYWLTVENPAPLRFDINYAQMGNDKVHPTYVTLNTPRPGATGYIEYRFDASAGSLGSHSTAVIQNSANKQDYSYFSQGDDYSYKNTGDYTLNPHITAYRNGLLIYGTEPAPSATPPLTAVVSASPTSILPTGITTLSATVSGGQTPYSYSFSGPGTLVPNGNTAMVSGLSAGVQTFTLVVSDATQPLSQSISATVSVTVSTSSPVNTAPVATANASQTATLGVPFAYTVNTFTDAETPASLTYSAQISPANSLSFDAANRVISGTPSLSGVSSVTITATDPGGLTATTSFSITIQPAPLGGNSLSLVASANPTVLLTTATTSLSANVSGGTQPYSYNFSGPGTLVPNGNTASVSGLNAGVQTFTLVVSDATQPLSQSLSTTVSVTVTQPNRPPTVATLVPPQSSTVNSAYTLSLANTFADLDTPASLTLSVAGLPTSLSLLGSIITGTPSTTLGSPYSLTVTATDPGGLSVSTSFVLTVNPAPLVTDRLSVLSRDPDNGQLNTNTLKPYLQLQNDGEQGIPYAEISVRYWLTVENPAPLRFDINYAQMGNDKVHPTYVTLNTPRPGATGYIEYRFDASAGSLGSHSTAVIQNSANKQDYSYFSQGDDYSYKNTGDYTLNPHITAYRNGLLIYGTEPQPVAGARQGTAQTDALVTVRVMSNPLLKDEIDVEVVGAVGQYLHFVVTDLQGHTITELAVDRAGLIERQRLPVGHQSPGILLLRVDTSTQSQTVKVLKAN